MPLAPDVMGQSVRCRPPFHRQFGLPHTRAIDPFRKCGFGSDMTALRYKLALQRFPRIPGVEGTADILPEIGWGIEELREVIPDQ